MELGSKSELSGIDGAALGSKSAGMSALASASTLIAPESAVANEFNQSPPSVVTFFVYSSIPFSLSNPSNTVLRFQSQYHSFQLLPYSLLQVGSLSLQFF